ncbi:hypothetical protein [Luteibacter yeojuensis]|uniref:BP74 N-terminal domain-containing protein n=1 Tax=Luteibacter yeojuensis TaxID=345309 RepID=A0A7X5QUV4_9GAMM|nr:hypothetical protein [Luteibacter yeojuensis]NID15834.1 hypothetical protein [Luteibacter yeojuensis]
MRSLIAGSTIAAFALLSAQAHAETAYFSFVSPTVSQPGIHEFVFGATDPQTIARLRDVVTNAGTLPARLDRVRGVITTERRAYNQDWPFHFVPSTVRFTEGLDAEACDATPFEIESNLHLVGGSYLPRNEWCPYSMRLVREVSVANPETQE